MGRVLAVSFFAGNLFLPADCVFLPSWFVWHFLLFGGVTGAAGVAGEAGFQVGLFPLFVFFLAVGSRLFICPAIFPASVFHQSLSVALIWLR